MATGLSFRSAPTRERIAYHESGHAVLGLMVAGADPVYRVMIVPRGQALGVTYQRPQEDRYNYPEAYLRARIVGMRIEECHQQASRLLQLHRRALDALVEAKWRQSGDPRRVGPAVGGPARGSRPRLPPGPRRPERFVRVQLA